MNFKRFQIEGPVLIEPKVFGDERGFFLESFKASLCKTEGIPTDFSQDNHSRSSKGVLRGMHPEGFHHHLYKIKLKCCVLPKSQPYQ